MSSPGERSTTHEEWMDESVDQRGKHPIAQIRQNHDINPGDECPIEDCDTKWDLRDIASYASKRVSTDQNKKDNTVIARLQSNSKYSGVQITSGFQIISCTDPTCPLSMCTPKRAREYLEGIQEIQEYNSEKKKAEIKDLIEK
jgi:hypothetical protein